MTRAWSTAWPLVMLASLLALAIAACDEQPQTATDEGEQEATGDEGEDPPDDPDQDDAEAAGGPLERDAPDVRREILAAAEEAD